MSLRWIFLVAVQWFRQFLLFLLLLLLSSIIIAVVRCYYLRSIYYYYHYSISVLTMCHFTHCMEICRVLSPFDYVLSHNFSSNFRFRLAEGKAKANEVENKKKQERKKQQLAHFPP